MSRKERKRKERKIKFKFNNDIMMMQLKNAWPIKIRQAYL